MIPAERAHLFVAAHSHKGMKKGKNNEDRYAVSSYILSKENPVPLLFAIVADGVGGHLAGEIAAEMVVDYVSDAIVESDAQEPVEIIRNAVEGANESVRGYAEGDESKEGMGSTCVCAWIIGNRLYAGSVGDSRLYLMRGATIQQLTTDHTWIQEALDKGILTPEQARNHPNVHVIRQYIGGKNLPVVDFRLRLSTDIVQGKENVEAKRSNQGFRLEAGDTLLLCSDGLTDLVWNDEILEIVRTAKDLDNAAKTLINTANERGGHDNSTVILLSVPQNKKALKKKLSPGWIIGSVVVALLIISVLLGLIWYAVQPPVTPTVTPSATATVVAPSTATQEIFSTSTPPPTIGATYTPWPTSTP